MTVLQLIIYQFSLISIQNISNLLIKPNLILSSSAI